MKKENDISFYDFFDFEVFALPDQNFELESKNKSPGKGILIIYSNEKNDPDLEVLLKNILSAANLAIEKDIFLLKTTAQKKYSFNDIMGKLSVKDFIFFGIHPSNFGLNYSMKPYQPLKVKQLRFLQIDSLEEINFEKKAEEKKNRKKNKALWSCLKEMYLDNQSS